MGRDKALFEVGDVALALTVSRALADAGASEVYCVGGDARRLHGLGLTVVADETPGEGPLGGLVSALRAAREELVAVLACDLPWVAATGIGQVVEALRQAPDAAWAAPRAEGRWQPLHAAYRRRALDAWERAFLGGERSLQAAAARLPGVEARGVDPALLADVDRPGDLPTDR